MNNNIILFKVIISFILLGFGLVFISIGKRIKINEKKVKVLLFLILIFSRLLLFFSVFVIMGFEPQSDLPAFYYPQAKNVLNGLLPYKDFISSYSPFFPYFTSIPILMYDSVKSIVLFSIIIELMSVLIWYSLAIENFNEHKSNLILLIYTLNPLSIINVAINGQNQIWISLFIGLTYYLLLRKHYYLAGVSFASGFLITKFLFLIFLLPILFFLRNKKRFLLGLILTLIIPFIVLAYYRVDFLIPVKIESQAFSSGNIIYLFTIFSSSLVSHSLVLNLFLLTIILAFLIYIKKNIHNKSTFLSDIPITIIISCLVFVLLMLFSKKSFTNYWTILLYPIIMLTINGNDLRNFLFFSLLGTFLVIEPSLWFRIMSQQTLDLNLIRDNLLSGFIFISIEIVLILFYIAIFRRLYFKLKIFI